MVENKVNPSDVLLLAFTRKAAREMLRKASTLLEDGRCEKVSGGTFHSFSSLILRQYTTLINYNNSFTILDGSDSEDVISLLRSQMRLDNEKRKFPKKKTLKDIFGKSVNTVKKNKEIIEKDYPYLLYGTYRKNK